MKQAAQSNDGVTPVDPTVLNGANVDQTSGAAQTPNSNLGTDGHDARMILRLIEAVAASRDRTAAIEALAGQFGIHFAGSSVRCGVGRSALSRLYDQRLGWLGPESSLFGEAQKRWSDAIGQTEYFLHDGDSLVVSIPQNDAEGECIVWIHGEQVGLSPCSWLQRCLPTMRILLWDKPARWWFRIPERVQHTSAWWWLASAGLLGLIACFPIRYRVPCTAVVQPVQQRLVAAPFEATLLESRRKPGDAIHAGDTLAILDGRPLRLEFESIQAELQEVSKEHDVALATGQIASAQQSALKENQLQRRLDLLSDRLKRLDVISPIAGVIVSGDLERLIGSPLDTGQTIFEVAPLDRMAVEIEIPEYEIGYVSAGNDARVKIASRSGRSLSTTLTKIYPAAEIRDNRNVFVARVEFDNANGELRPGMHGRATTYGPLRPLAWAWVRGAWEKTLWLLGY